MRFVKMHGIGNDYVYLDAVTEPALNERPDLPDLARRIADRHTGVGSDGLILVCRPTKGTAADVRMRMFNADGSESEMCGNGVRCVAKFAYDRLGVAADPLRVETGRGVLDIAYETAGGRLTRATVDMGQPIYEHLARIPVDQRHFAARGIGYHAILEASDRAFTMTFVSMGNPHAVIFEAGRRDLTPDEVRNWDLARYGPALERHPAFPNRVNVHVAAPVSHTEVVMRTWERGAGQTRACGTGACAVLAAGVITNRLDRRALIHLPGGDLTIEWPHAGSVLMTGPAEDVFTGEFPG